MFETIQKYVRKVARAIGLIKDINSIAEHKRINADEKVYSRISINKQLYQGYYPEWHDLRYFGTNRKEIERKQMSLGMPKILAKELAGLVFNEGVNISLADEARTQWELIRPVVESSKFIRELQRYLEYMFAFGGVAVEVYHDGEMPKVAYATADAFYPLSSDTENVDEAVIANQFKQDGKTYTLLKWHEWGEYAGYSKSGGVVGYNYRVKNELYESRNGDKLGDKVPLRTMFDDMEEVTYFNLDRPLFVYIKPNEANNKDVTSPLGLSIFDNCHDTLKMLDTMFDFWYNEFRLGKRRIAVPDYLLKTYYLDGLPYYRFDDSEEVYQAMTAGEMDGMQIKDLTIELRAEQVISSINALLDILSTQVGLSPGHFTFSEGGIKTATQVVSENSKTFRTRASHSHLIEDALRDLILTIYEVATMDMPTAPPLKRTDISIDFNDGVFQDKGAELEFYDKAISAGVVPKLEVIQRVFGKSKEEASEWLAQISVERTQANAFVNEAISLIEVGGTFDTNETGADDTTLDLG